eukprot:4147710-Alexandrium_andersonii.AAC.1
MLQFSAALPRAHAGPEEMATRGGGQGPEERGRAAESNSAHVSEPGWFWVSCHGQEANVVGDVRN